jgi:hypothetical protein
MLQFFIYNDLYNTLTNFAIFTIMSLKITINIYKNCIMNIKKQFNYSLSILITNFLKQNH